MDQKQVKIENENEKIEPLLAEYVRCSEKDMIKLKFGSDQKGELIASQNGVIFRVSDLNSETKAGEIWMCHIINNCADGSKIVLPVTKIELKQKESEQNNPDEVNPEIKNVKQLKAEKADLDKKLKKAENRLSEITAQLKSIQKINADLLHYKEKYEESSNLYNKTVEEYNNLTKNYNELKKQNNILQKKDSRKIESEYESLKYKYEEKENELNRLKTFISSNGISTTNLKSKDMVITLNGNKIMCKMFEKGRYTVKTGIRTKQLEIIPNPNGTFECKSGEMEIPALGLISDISTPRRLQGSMIGGVIVISLNS